MKSAIRDDNPVVYLHHYMLMLDKCPVPDGDYLVPFGVADIKRAGTDVTIVATAWMVKKSLAAAETLAKEGISAEVIDPRTLSPLDTKTIIESVKKTGRLVLVDRAENALFEIDRAILFRHHGRIARGDVLHAFCRVAMDGARYFGSLQRADGEFRPAERRENHKRSQIRSRCASGGGLTPEALPGGSAGSSAEIAQSWY